MGYWSPATRCPSSKRISWRSTICFKGGWFRIKAHPSSIDFGWTSRSYFGVNARLLVFWTISKFEPGPYPSEQSEQTSFFFLLTYFFMAAFVILVVLFLTISCWDDYLGNACFGKVSFEAVLEILPHTFTSLSIKSMVNAQHTAWLSHVRIHL